jgi:hypothetical protein
MDWAQSWARARRHRSFADGGVESTTQKHSDSSIGVPTHTSNLLGAWIEKDVVGNGKMRANVKTRKPLYPVAAHCGVWCSRGSMTGITCRVQEELIIKYNQQSNTLAVRIKTMLHSNVELLLPAAVELSHVIVAKTVSLISANRSSTTCGSPAPWSVNMC